MAFQVCVTEIANDDLAALVRFITRYAVKSLQARGCAASYARFNRSVVTCV